MVIRLIFAAVLAALVPAKAFAWGPDGHRIICTIAWDTMKPEARTRAEQILKVSGRAAFADSCNWADDYRSKEGHQETAAWHYVNVPMGALRVDMQRDCSGPDSCVMAQIDRWREALANPNTKPDERAMALKFVGHFVGDIHQPLHASHAEDRRGGAITGTFLGKPYDFHWLWDDGILHAYPMDWHETVETIERQVSPALRTKWAASTPLDWANESLAIANDPNTKYVDWPFELGDDYAKAELPVVYTRLVRAGVRLGAMLDTALAGSQ